MTDLQAALERLHQTIAYDDNHLALSGRKGAAYVGDLRALLTDHAEQEGGILSLEREILALRADADRERVRAEAAEADVKLALKQCGEWARQAGEARGKLETSELAWIVEGWKERAEAAEGALRQSTADLSAARPELPSGLAYAVAVRVEANLAVLRAAHLQPQAPVMP